MLLGILCKQIKDNGRVVKSNNLMMVVSLKLIRLFEDSNPYVNVTKA